MLVKDGAAWDRTADVVIVGYGMAGAVAAITARDAGAEVLVVEKQPADNHHTFSSLSGGTFLSPSDVKGAIEYIKALCHVDGEISWTDPDIIRVWAEYAVDNKGWMERLGGKFKFGGTHAEHPDLPGAGSIDRYLYSGSGLRMMQFLYEQAKERGVQVMYGAAARKLLTDGRGEVVGVRVQRDEGGFQGEMTIGASRAVVLTCGGFEFNEEMKLQYLKAYPTHFYGSPANTGDGIKMAMEVGADLWHMNCVSARVVAKFPEFPIAFMLDFGGRGWTRHVILHENVQESTGFILTDRYGKRFTNENFRTHCFYYELSLYDTQKRVYPRIPCYFIFDQRRMEAGPLPVVIAGPCGPSQLYEWSRDNSAELEKGWITSAGTVRELSRKLEMSPVTLEKTIRSYNSYGQKGKDPEFNRRTTDLVPLDSPPYYAVKLWPGGANTQGGPKRNGRAQVLNTDGDPIPRLYSAGELGSLFGMLYPQGGGNLSECIVFGRIAGENASREQPTSARVRRRG